MVPPLLHCLPEPDPALHGRPSLTCPTVSFCFIAFYVFEAKVLKVSFFSALEKEVAQLNCKINQLENTVLGLEKMKEELDKKIVEAAKEKDSFVNKAGQMETKIVTLEKENESTKKAPTISGRGFAFGMFCWYWVYSMRGA